MTLTLSCACYTNIPIDLGLPVHNQTCNCELNLSTVVSLIRDNFMFVYHCVFNVYNLVPCRPTYHLRLFLLCIVWLRLSTIMIKRK